MAKLSILVVLLVAVLASGCVLPNIVALRGSGNLVTLEQPYADFDRVEIGYAFQADITQGDGYSVVVTIDDNLERYLQVSKTGDTLRVGLEPGTVATDATMRVSITMPDLVALEASGAAQARIAGFENNTDFRMDVSGASSVTGDLTTGDIAIDVSGASRARLEGAGQRANVTVSGASTADLVDFAVTSADVDASGASRASVNVSGRLDATASGASRVEYVGNPTMGTIDTSGASTIQQR